MSSINRDSATAQKSFWVLFLAIVFLAPLATYARNGTVLMPFVLAAIIFFRYGFSGLFAFEKSIFVPLFLLFAWGLASAIWSEFPHIEKAPALALTAFVGAIVVLAPKKMSADDIKQYSRAICYLGIASAVLFSVQFIFDFPIMRFFREDFRFGSADGNITPIALLVYPIGIALFLEYRSKAAGFLGVGVLLIVIAMGPMFAATVAVCMASIMFIAAYFFPRQSIIVFFSILILYVVTSPVLHKEFVTVERSSQLPVSLNQTWVHRLGIWTFTSVNIAESPILGIGLRGSRYMGKGQILAGTNLPAMSWHPHNAALQVWLELGIFGVLLVVAICLGMARLLWRMRHERLFIAMSIASITTFTVISLLSFGLWQNWWHGTIWVTAFIVSLMRQRLNLEERTPDQAKLA